MVGAVRVLLVDDEPDFAELVADFLERENDQFTVVTATSASEGHDRLAEENPDCVVSDYEMPDRNGIEFLEAIREEYPDLPFILFTGRGSEEHRARANYREVFRKIPDGVLLHDPTDGTILDVNRKFCDMLGYSRDELFDGGFTTIHPGEPPHTTERAERLVRKTAHEGSRTFEWVDETKAGDPLPVEVHLREAVIDGDQRVLAVVRDISDRKERERELERERERYRSLFENTPVVTWEEDFSAAKAYVDDLAAEVDDLGTYLEAHPEELHAIMDRIDVIDVNRNALQYYGADSKAELIANLDRIFTEEAFDALRAMWVDIAAGETEFRTETVSRTFDGERNDEILAMYVPDPYTEEYSRVYVVTIDITKRKRHSRELERQNQRLEEFASLVSHDLRNPLNVASGNLELAREECDSDRLEAVADAHDRMGTLIDDLLTLAREGAPIAEREPIDLAATVDACWRNVDTADAELAVDAERVVEADRSRLQQLLENLFRNAVEHGSTSSRTEPDDAVEHGGGNTTVRVGETDDGFYVADDGPGVPADERERVFEGGYSTGEANTGFGLLIVERIAEAHGWEVALVESEDGGARFEIDDVEGVGR
ncbi:hypothetical protein BRC98_02360 [Halobacteriales archaeon QS_7_68_65]|nr:MAG: hypothetical protein BRC98_02360 [Halobacteriales archaeon QS_7_68_65]